MTKFTTAKRHHARLRLGVMGASGSGKTMGSLRVALGIASAPEKIFVIDTERRSAELYAHLGAYQVACLEGNFDPAVYSQTIHDAEKAGAEVIIIDSLSHAWEGEGGALDQVDAATAKSKSGNSYTAWRDVTPKHRALVDAMLQSPCHIIATLRAKQEYVMEKDERTGKTTVRKVGLAPIQRAGMEYEFTAFLDVNDSHISTATKDRTSLLDGKTFQLTEDIGKKLLGWLNSGEAPEPVEPVHAPAAAAAPVAAPKQSERALLLDAAISHAVNAEALEGVRVQLSEAKPALTSAEVAALAAHYKNKKAKLETEAARNGEPSKLPEEIPFGEEADATEGGAQ